MQGCELLSVAEMTQADRLAVAGHCSGLKLMERAGRAVAAEASAMLGGPASVLIACGPGNNGGDGFVAARLLRDQGYRVRLALFGAREALRGDAATMAARWGGPCELLTPDLVGSAGDLIIDALFGAGLSRPLEGMAGLIVEAINASGKAVVSVDVPSGLNGSTGAADGPCVEATRTVTFFRLKPGHVLLPGRELCGKVTLADIGIPETTLEQIAPRTFLNRPALWSKAFPRQQARAHKYLRGHTVVISGPAESTGAARLGARAALRIGSGLVTLAGSAAATAINATHSTAVMVKALASDTALVEFLSDQRRNAVLVGPGAGVGSATAATVLSALAAAPAVVLDADALTSFAAAAEDSEVRAFGFGFVVRDLEPPPSGQSPFPGRAGAHGAGRADAARGRVQAPVWRAAWLKARPSPHGRRAQRRGGAAQGCRYGGGGSRRPGSHQRQCARLARHRRFRRCVGRLYQRIAGPAHGGVRSRLRGGLAAWRLRQNLRTRAHCRGPGGNIAAGALKLAVEAGEQPPVIYPQVICPQVICPRMILHADRHAGWARAGGGERRCAALTTR